MMRYHVRLCENLEAPGFPKKLPHATRETQRHRQIKSRSFLANIRGRQVDGYSLPSRGTQTRDSSAPP